MVRWAYSRLLLEAFLRGEFALHTRSKRRDSMTNSFLFVRGRAEHDGEPRRGNFNLVRNPGTGDNYKHEVVQIRN